MAITRTPWIDDDGSGTTGTVINNAEKTLLYNQIDAAIAAGGGQTSGTWLPILQGNAGAPTGQTYALREGFWLRVGPHVHVTGRIILSAKGTIPGVAVKIGGLPVPVATSAGGAAGAITIPYYGGLATAINALLGAPAGGTSYVSLYVVPTTGGVAVGDLDPAMVSNATDLMFAGFYLTT